MKKLLLTAASTILAVGVLAACGDQDVDDPTMNEETDFGTETESDMGGFEEEPTMDESLDEGTEEFPATEDESSDFESDLDMGEEEDSFEFESEENDLMEDES
ncbi:hypothetical protein BTR23_22915 [Alkalihalophilus pseudofirmus]|uniref:hypothetical protein n=1 Tax=Alkalihalobacterium alkalinitrilicum TaxID=427920 RepID=UPI00094D3246|nr:hypothetical protein [Alkalihalobacterium alkalinitrilicum]OLO26546.1 hypothetical protein BTR23_22915 [Alkalihalophilus pseudofirmus]